MGQPPFLSHFGSSLVWRSEVRAVTVGFSTMPAPPAAFAGPWAALLLRPDERYEAEKKKEADDAAPLEVEPALPSQVVDSREDGVVFLDRVSDSAFQLTHVTLQCTKRLDGEWALNFDDDGFGAVADVGFNVDSGDPDDSIKLVSELFPRVLMHDTVTGERFVGKPLD
eukprot:7186546-Pyramimonas_sp.AAC.2